MSMSDKAQSSPRIKIRIESLSDLVFGLALSIGSLELLARTPQNAEELETSIAFFAFSFFIVVSIWIGYARIIAVISQETSGVLGLNLLLLFCVALEPYLFFIVQSASSLEFLDSASVGYALDAGGMFLILSGLTRLVLRRRNPGASPDLHPVLVRRFRLGMITYAVIGFIYVLSALPFFWVRVEPIGYLRFLSWYSAFAFAFLGLLNRRRERTRHYELQEHLDANLE